MRRLLAAGLGAALLAGLGCTPADTDLRPVGDFTLTERGGRPVGRGDLAGKLWVAGFVFTRCTGPCPVVTGNMADLQRRLAGYDEVRLVTFTVDPEHDTPEVLRRHADRYGADPDRWLFLTGGREQVYAVIRDSFQLGVQQTEGPERTPGNEVAHSTRLVLVDDQGRICGYYDGTNPADVQRLANRVEALAWLHRLPGCNAVLNSASAVLLVLGYVAIRRRWVRVHKAAMLAALTVSALFLASYLYYHLVVRGGQPTYFRDRAPEAPPWVQALYSGVLLSHTLLAMAVAPLALVTAYLGLSGRLPRHVTLARWTLPLWLYVSVTGVVVYWMLYRLYPSR